MKFKFPNLKVPYKDLIIFWSSQTYFMNDCIEIFKYIRSSKCKDSRVKHEFTDIVRIASQNGAINIFKYIANNNGNTSHLFIAIIHSIIYLSSNGHLEIGEYILTSLLDDIKKNKKILLILQYLRQY